MNAAERQKTPAGGLFLGRVAHVLEDLRAPTRDTEHARRVRADRARDAGVHLACFGTPTAEFEHTRLADHGFEPPPRVRLRRAPGGRGAGGGGGLRRGYS